MNKQEFTNKVALTAGLSKKDAASAVNSMLDIITEQLTNGEQVQFVGFGTFSTSNRAARKAKVPGTSKIVDVPATTVAKFKVGKLLKTAVAKG